MPMPTPTLTPNFNANAEGGAIALPGLHPGKLKITTYFLRKTNVTSLSSAEFAQSSKG